MEDKDFEKIYKLIEEEQFETAKKLLDEILLKDVGDIEAQKLMALCEVNLDNYAVAKYILEEIIKYKQDDALCWYYLGCCYDAENNIIAAKHAYLKVLELRPEYIDAYASLAIVYIKMEDYENAIKTGKEALKYTEEDEYSIYYILGTACMAAQDFEQSVLFIEKALAIEPENFQLYNNLGTSYLTIGNTDKALEAYEKARELDPSDSLTYYNIASILQLQENHIEACKYFEKANSLEPEEDSYIVAWALSEVKAGLFASAIEHYKYLAATYPQKTNYKYNLACCYQAVGNYEVAISLLKQLIMLNPKAVNVLKKLASIYIATGQLANAKDIYEKIIKQGTVADEIYYELAQLCIRTDDTDKAEQTLKKVCGLNPQHAQAHKDLGVIYLNKRLFDYAKDEFEKAYQIAPNDATIVVEYANYLHSTSDFVKADEFYAKALELDPDNANALAFSALNKTHLKQLDIAESLKMPVVIHQRDCGMDVLEILKKRGVKDGVVLHCFSESVEMAKEFVKLGCYISLGGVITYKNAGKLLDVAKFVPKDLLLTETDSPYLTPVPKRGKRNEPKYTNYVLDKLAELRNEDREQLAQAIENNFKRVFTKIK